jgi:hypothetical protein
LLILYVWYFSRVFRCLPFLSVLITCIVSVKSPYSYPVLSIRLEYPELLLLFPMSRMCSLYQIEWSACLPYVFQWAAHAFHLICHCFHICLLTLFDLSRFWWCFF